MDFLKEVADNIGYISAIAGFVAVLVKFWREQKKAKEGQLCLLRAEMLKIYFRNKDRECLNQYEADNFKLMYASYKAQGGNSFIDEVNKHVSAWELEK